MRGILPRGEPTGRVRVAARAARSLRPLYWRLIIGLGAGLMREGAAMVKSVYLAAILILAAGEAALALSPIALWIEPDGTSYLWNTSETATEFWGYEFTSFAPDLDVSGWHSIARTLADDPNFVFASFGPNAVLQRSGSIDATVIYEHGQLALGPGLHFPIGHPFATGRPDPTDDLRYIPPFLATAFRMDVVYAPEPSTFLLAAMAGLGLLAFRGRGATAFRRVCD